MRSLPMVELISTPQALAELAFVGTVWGRSSWVRQPQLFGEVLRLFWSSERRLQQQWLRQLMQVGKDFEGETQVFEQVAMELFVTDMVTRVWGTNWTIADRLQGNSDVEQIVVNSLSGLEKLRRDLLLLMVHRWESESNGVISRLDRFRRRAERWADLLIAGPASLHGVWDYAVEPRRSRDFGEETWQHETSSCNPVSLLVSAGLRVMYGTPWPANCCTATPFAELMRAIFMTLPEAAFQQNGRLKPAWEWCGSGGVG
ncbi:MAG: hypothetical protein U0872_00495 [Planctomycetaceae bacterium]